MILSRRRQSKGAFGFSTAQGFSRLGQRVQVFKIFNEREISQYLDKLHTFGDAATLRRTLCSLGLMSRSKDGSNYQKQDKEPPADALTLIGVLGVSPH